MIMSEDIFDAILILALLDDYPGRKKDCTVNVVRDP